MTVQSYPLAWPPGWPRTKTGDRQRRSFEVGFDRARKDLRNEIRLMGGTNEIISSMLPLRRNGEAYTDDAEVRLEDPGVAVYFMRHGKQVVLARDAYLTVRDNLRSLGLAIEHLRGLERHGGAPMLERAFEGFTALPSGDGRQEASCWEILDVVPGAPKEAILDKFREKAKTAHPDLGGSPEAFAILVKARDQAMAALMA